MKAQPPHHLRAYRKRTKASQQTIADHINIDRTYYSRIENGERGYTQEILEGLARHYGVEPAHLLSRNPSKAADLWEIVGRLKPNDLIRITEIARTLADISDDTKDSA